MKKKQVMLKIEMDKRIIEKRLMCGEMCEKDLEDYLDDLPDLADNAENIIID